MVKVGDLVRIVRGDSIYYDRGTLARVTLIDKDGDAWGDFRDLGNPEGSHHYGCDSTWCIGQGPRFIVIPPTDAVVEPDA